MPDSIEEHKHRFSAWAASRAASVKGSRFSVEIGNKILGRSDLPRLIENPDMLPDAENVDENHRLWRQKVIRLAKEENIDFTHGVAAKLINIYFKSAFVCA